MAKPLQIDQVTTGIMYGDAISNYVLNVQKILRQKGVKSDIYVIHPSPNCLSLLKKSNLARLKKSDWALFHYGLGSPIANILMQTEIKTCLIYHNITPAHYFKDQPHLQQICQFGRDQLPLLAHFCSLSAGVSQYNANELEQYGFKKPHYLPLIVNPPECLEIDEALHAQLSANDYKNIIFVGRLAPNKRQDQLIKIFAKYVAHHPKTRLLLIGSASHDIPYVQYIFGLIAAYGLKDKVIIPGHIDDRTLQTYFRSAHLFLSTSEHEGFCVPLVEAMWYEIPIIAYKSSAIPETLHTGILFDDLNNIPEICGLIDIVLHNSDIQQNILKAQAKRRQDFTEAKFGPHLDHLLKYME